LKRKFRSFGYQSIETPSLEFFEAFSREVGTTPANEMYRLFDRDGNMLALRPDFTPSVARSVSMYFTEENGPLRLCYSGSVFQNNSHYQGRLHESTQMGVELIGEDSPEADAEIIALVVEGYARGGTENFQVSLGHVDYFQSLADEAGLDEETQAELRGLLLTQNRFGAEEQIAKLRLRSDLQDAFEAIPELFGDASVLVRARSLTDNRRALAGCEPSREDLRDARAYGCEKYVTFDMGMLSAYRYYTGIIFQAFTYGTGDALIKGGRYDTLLERYGKKSPAIGFTTEIDSLLTALDRQGIDIPIRDVKTMILYPARMEAQCVRYAASIRARGSTAPACASRRGACWMITGRTGRATSSAESFILNRRQRYTRSTSGPATVQRIGVGEGEEGYEISDICTDEGKTCGSDPLPSGAGRCLL
jgi:ATP phosphoribosyltransferase regulatory subunit